MFRLWITIVILQFLLSAAVVFAKDIKSYSEIPEDANPNYEVLEHYLKKYISYSDIKNRPYKFTITPNNPKELILDLTTDEYVIKQLNKTSMISYLMYEDGEIVLKIDSVIYLLMKHFGFLTLLVNLLCHMFMDMLFVEDMLMVYIKL